MAETIVSPRSQAAVRFELPTEGGVILNAMQYWWDHRFPFSKPNAKAKAPPVPDPEQLPPPASGSPIEVGSLVVARWAGTASEVLDRGVTAIDTALEANVEAAFADLQPFEEGLARLTRESELVGAGRH